MSKKKSKSQIRKERLRNIKLLKEANTLAKGTKGRVGISQTEANKKKNDRTNLVLGESKMDRLIKRFADNSKTTLRLTGNRSKNAKESRRNHRDDILSGEQNARDFSKKGNAAFFGLALNKKGNLVEKRLKKGEQRPVDRFARDAASLDIRIGDAEKGVPFKKGPHLHIDQSDDSTRIFSEAKGKFKTKNGRIFQAALLGQMQRMNEEEHGKKALKEFEATIFRNTGKPIKKILKEEAEFRILNGAEDIEDDDFNETLKQLNELG